MASRQGLLVFQEALRALEGQAVDARKKRGLPHSRREAARDARRFQVVLDDRRIGEWLRRDDGRAPRDPDQVWGLVQVWCAWAGRIPKQDERRYWNDLVEQAWPPRPGPSDGVGRPLSEWPDPLALEVHPAIESPGRELPVLPEYVGRAHDADLERIVAEAQDVSAMAVLVGGSATGKTRACWEALRLLPDGWRLWHPIAPGRPQAALKEIALVGSRTVVWLNDIQHYLLTPGSELGEQVAAELRMLLRDPARGPVLVLGTVWPRYWRTLTGYSTPDEDPHAQARALLTGTDLPIPATFSRPELDRARAATDPRLAEAVRHAEDGHLTQYLAGGPALQALYRTASDGARAVLNAAIDARRLGHGPLLSRRLLLDAARGYLTRPQREMLENGWQDEVFAHLTDHRPCRGARAPLTPVPPEEDDPKPCDEPRYRLADYLEQTGQAQRRTFAVPEALWKALLTHVQGSDLIRIGQQAQRRGLYSYALRFYRAAYKADPELTDAMMWAGDLHRSAGHIDEALLYYRRAAEGGDPYAWTRAADMLRGDGRLETALEWYERAVADGVPYALSQAADMFATAGEQDRVMELLYRAEAAGVAEASARLGRRLYSTGRRNEATGHFQAAAEHGETPSLPVAVNLLLEFFGLEKAIEWLESRRPCGDAQATAAIARLLWERGDHDGAIELVLPLCEENPSLVRTAGDWLDQVGRQDEAIDLYRRVAGRGDAWSLRTAVKLLRETSRTPEAIDWLRTRVAVGDSTAMTHAVALYEATGQTPQAIDWLRGLAQGGDVAALSRLADLLYDAGQPAEAIRLYEDFTGDIGISGLRQLAGLLEEDDRVDDAIRCFQSAVERGDGGSLLDAAGLIDRVAGSDEAIDWLRARVVTGGGEPALRLVIESLLASNRVDEAIDWLRARVEDGDLAALGWAANLLRDTGRPDEALAYYLRGAEAGLAGRGSGDHDSGMLELAADLLRGIGREDDAVRVVRYGVEPGGRIAAGPQTADIVR